VELPAPDARRGRSRRRLRGNTGRAPQARGDDAAHRASSATSCARGGAPARRRQHRHRRRPHQAPQSSITPTSTRSLSPAQQRLARQFSAAHAEHYQSSRSSSAAKRRTSSSTTARSTRPSRGIVSGIYFNQGHVCCGLAPLRAGIDLRAARRSWSDASRRCASATRSTRTRRRRDRLEDAARQDRRARGSGQGRKARRSTSRRALPEKGCWFVPTVFTNVAQSYRIAQGDLRARC
jgi:hypothetical protein